MSQINQNENYHVKDTSSSIYGDEYYIFNESKPFKERYSHFLNIINDKLKNKQFKNLLKLIENFSMTNKECLTNEIPEYFILCYIKTICYLKIIDHKIKKYSIERKNPTINNARKKTSTRITKIIKNSSVEKVFLKKNLMTETVIIIKNIENYFKLTKNTINHLISIIKYHNNKIEFVIEVYLNYLLLYSKFKNKLNKINEKILYLIFAKKLIDIYKPFIHSTKTLKYVQEIYINLFKDYFINKNYEEAEKICKELLEFCFKEIIFRLNKDNLIDLKKIKNIEKDNLIYLKFCLGLIYLGMIKENLGQIILAKKYYLFSYYVAKELLFGINKNFQNMFFEMAKRSLEYKNIYELLKFENNNIIKLKKAIEEEEIQKNIMLKNKYKYKGNIKNNKDSFIINKIENLKIPENDFNFKNSKSLKKNYSNYLLNNMKLIDNLSSNSFKNTIKSMKNINLIDIDYNIKKEIQTIINKKNHRPNKLLKYKNLCNKLQINTFSNNNLNISNKSKSQNNILIKYKKLKTSISMSNNTINTSKINNNNNNNDNKNDSNNNNNNSNYNIYYCLNSNSYKNLLKFDNTNNNSLNKNYSFKTLNTINSIPKYKIEFTKSFINKKNYLSKIHSRETNFLKNLLIVKKEQMLDNIETFNKRKVNDEADFEFQRIKNSLTKNKIETDFDLNPLKIFKMYEKKKENNENILNKLGYNNLLDYINEEKKKEKENQIKSNLLNKDYVYNNNKNIINKLDINIQNLIKEEFNIKKDNLLRKNN